jgi:hypothetical protein
LGLRTANTRQDAYDPSRAPWNQGRRDRQLQGVGLTPFTRFGWPGYQLLQSPFEDSI